MFENHDLCHEAYVSLETAKKLRAAGFDWYINSFYQEGSTQLPEPHEFNNREVHDTIGVQNWNNYSGRDREYISCPTLAVAQRWLLEVKDYVVLVEFSVTNNHSFLGAVTKSNEPYKSYHVRENWDGKYFPYKVFSRYEEALEEAILLALDMMKEEE